VRQHAATVVAREGAVVKLTMGIVVFWYLSWNARAGEAQAPVRLADLVREAREHNPEVRAAQAQTRAAAAAVGPAGAFDDPMLMVQLWNGPVDFSTVPIMVQLTQQIPLGGKREARRDAASAE